MNANGTGTVDLRVSVAGIEFKNPILLASGTVGFGHEYNEFFDLSEIGGICVKGLTPKRREGNAPPRIAETASGMLNSVGLQNPGVDAFIRSTLPFLRRFDTKVIANISGGTVEDYREMAERLDGLCDMLEVNISCPNVKAGGLAFGTSPISAAEVVGVVKKAAKKTPIMVKLSPNVTDICEIARACEAAGADALALINTLLGMKIDINTRRPILRNNVGGLSGPAILPVAVRCIWQVKNATSLPIVGMGGVATSEDAIELMLAGASAVSIGTAIFANPTAPIEIRDGIAAHCEKHGISSVRQLTGGVMAW